ncbi:hypothetical protein, partial [Limosilactobacillus reuteri]|uniref:hypothetical protein n=1 Tax=Limosilactobacillus reuteri TaxID=1598 RepID=UPI00207C97DE
PVLSEAQASLAILDTKATAAFDAKKRYRIGLQLAEVADSCLAATVDGLDYERVSAAAGLDKVKSDLTSRSEWRPHA